MIAHLQALIKQAKAEIEELKIKIKEAKDELEICKQLLALLIKIGSDASSGGHALNSAASSLNKGIRIGGVGQGEKISERAAKMMELQSNSETGAANVQNRIDELEKNIEMWTAKIGSLQSSIAGWSAEIARLQEAARRAREAEERALSRKKNK